MDQAEGFFDFYLKHLCARNDLGTDRGRLAVVKAMGEALQKTGSAVLVATEQLPETAPVDSFTVAVRPHCCTETRRERSVELLES